MVNESKKLKQREEIDSSFKWNLSKMYETDAMWEKDFQIVRELAEGVKAYAGRLHESSETLLEAFRKKEELSRKIGNIYVYARMKKDEDNRVTKYQAMSEKAQSLSVEISMKLSFFTPELLGIPEEKLMAFLEENEDLRLYDFFIKDLLRNKPHILSKEEEYIIAQFGEMMAAPESIFRMINNADIKFGHITDEDGEEIELTHGKFINFMESPDRRVRKEAFEALYSAYKKQKNTLASTYNYSTKGDAMGAKLRKYDS
ncbi:MAG: oligoendopeptidase F, partial [Peptostreptococcales bacterium]